MVRTRRVSGATAASRPRRHVLRGPGYFKRLSPGIVTGAADDPSDIGTYAQVGAATQLAALSALAVLP